MDEWTLDQVRAIHGTAGAARYKAAAIQLAQAYSDPDDRQVALRALGMYMLQDKDISSIAKHLRLEEKRQALRRAEIAAFTYAALAVDDGMSERAAAIAMGLSAGALRNRRIRP